MVHSISILGCTGSIGRQTVDVAEHMGMPVAALAASRSVKLLEEQARRLKPKLCAVYDESAARDFKIAVADTDIKVVSGIEGLIEAATLDAADCVVTAVSGAIGLKPTLAAIDAIELFSSGAAKRCCATVGVIADRDVRLRRITARDGISLEYAMMRVNAQRPDQYYLERCDYILKNNGTREEFSDACLNLFMEVLQK